MARIVYLSWPATEITGGIKLVFRHVEALQAADCAAVVATPDGRAPTWFKTTAPVVPLKEIAAPDDVLVFPENHSGFLREFGSWNNRKVVFCQNHFMTFRGLEGKQDYADYGVQTLLCVSQEAAGFCRRRFPEQNVLIIPPAIDRKLFSAREPKQLQIAFMAKKRPMEASFITDLFRAENPAFRGLSWNPIANANEQKVAHILAESAVFLSLSRFESLGLVALEALASGCVVAGFTGFGGREYATARNGFWTSEDDVIACTEQLARAVRLAVEGGDRLRDVTENAVLTAEHYSAQRFRERLTACWKQLAPNAWKKP